LAVCAFAADSQSFQIKERARPDLPELTITVETIDSGGAADRFVAVQAIKIHQNQQLIEAISFDDDLPVTAKNVNPVAFEDFDCDGYRDIALTISTGNHGDFWKQLFRFDPKRQKFVLVKGFDQYPSPQPDCKLKLLHTYVNSGFAGCMYERGVYRWVGRRLDPVERESQMAAPQPRAGFIRTIDTWEQGRKTRRVVRIPKQDCHIDP
jgi:hypothetical protein